MTPISADSLDPLPLTHSWPLFERDSRFDLGCAFDRMDAAAVPSADDLLRHGIGRWECDLRDNRLSWSAATYDLLGFPRGAHVGRDDSVALYAEPSRAAMERLRAYAIRHRRGFSLDAEIMPANGGRRWIRIVAAPLDIDHRPALLHGFKRDVTHEYI